MFEVAKTICLTLILIHIAIYDFRYRRIPNVLIVLGLLMWAVCIAIDFTSYYLSNGQECIMQTVYGAYFTEPTEIVLCAILSSAIYTVASIFVAFIVSKITHKESFGAGDIKMIFMLCLFFDFRLGAIVIGLACIVGLVFMLIVKFASKKQYENSIPFGLALAIAGAIVSVI